MPVRNRKTLTAFQLGKSRNLRVTVTDKLTNTPVDVSGDKFYFTVKDHADTPDADAALQSNVVASGADATNGIAVIPVSTAQTANVRPSTYFYDFVWVRTVSAAGQIEPVEQGTVSFEQAITHALS